jgi:hypothetical protein
MFLILFMRRAALNWMARQPVVNGRKPAKPEKGLAVWPVQLCHQLTLQRYIQCVADVITGLFQAAFQRKRRPQRSSLGPGAPVVTGRV